MGQHYRGVAMDGLTVINKGRGYVIKPKALNIVWGADTRYWRLPRTNEDSAELLQVSWIEVTGSLDLSKLNGDTTYKLSFKVSMKPDAFGWKGSPVYMMVKVGDGKYIWKSADLSNSPPNTTFDIPADLLFTVSRSDLRGSNPLLRFGLYEIWRGRWKGGLVIHSVEITAYN